MSKVTVTIAVEGAVPKVIATEVPEGVTSDECVNALVEAVGTTLSDMTSDDIGCFEGMAAARERRRTKDKH